MSIAWRIRVADVERNLPEGWEIRRIGDLVNLANGYPFPSDSFGPNGEVPLVRIRELVTYVDDFNTYISGYIPPECVLEDGDIVVGMDGDFNVVRWMRGKAALNQRLCRLRPREGADIRFIGYALPPILSIINDLTFSTTVKHLSSSDILSERLPLPPFDEQRRIADFLDVETAYIQRIETRRSQQKEHLANRRWSLLQELVERTPSDKLPLRRLLQSVTDGPFGSAFASSDYTNDGAAVVRLGNIGFADYRPQDQAYIPMSLFQEFRKYDVNEGDILVAGLGDPRNHAGRACIAPDLGPAIVKGKCFRARAIPGKASAEFIALILSSPIGASSLEGRGSTRSMINLEILKSAILPIPSFPGQVAMTREVNTYWKSALTAIQACDRQLALLAERRQALITAAVTGGITV